MNSSAVESPREIGTRRSLPPTGYCEHASARRIRVYLPYADANTIRLRAAQTNGSREPHVSWLYPVPGGWGWTICPECRSLEHKSA